MVVTSSNAQLDVRVLFDISGTTPVIQLTNLSIGDPAQSPMPVLDDLTWAVNITSPSGTPIYTSDFESPFQSGVWANETITNAWPRPFNQIEWSGADYVVDFSVLDNATAKIYNFSKVATICKPTGSTKQNTDTYGRIPLKVQTICNRKSLYIQDTSSKIYRGVTGESLSSYLAVDYPRDVTGVLPAPFTITDFKSDALVPITSNGKGYHATYQTVLQYGLGDEVYLKIRYTSQLDFDVTCNADLCIIDCQIQGLINELESGKCDDVEEAKRRLFIINGKAHQAAIGIEYPSCGIDVFALIDEIKSIGGYECDCSSTSDGLGSQSTLIDGVLYNVVSEGGDVTGRFEQTANNITLYISDKTYTFSVCADSDTDAFEFRPSTNGNVKSTCLYVKKSTLADELLTTIAADVNLSNLFNTIVNSNSSTLISVDGGCVIETNPVSDYSWQLNNVPATGTFASLISVIFNGVTKPLNYLFNQTNLPAFQNYLNTLGMGTFAVSFSGSTVTINSSANGNSFSSLKYNPGSGITIATQTTTNVGVQPIPVEQIVQAIIAYICAIDDTKIVTSGAYEICYVNEDGEKVTATINAASTLDALFAAISTFNCTTVDYIVNLKSASCDSIKAAFPTSNVAITATDYVLGTKGGNCARIPVTQLFLDAIQNIDETTLSALCEKIIECGAGKTCKPYDYLQVIVSAHDNTCSNIVGIQGTWS